VAVAETAEGAGRGDRDVRFVRVPRGTSRLRAPSVAWSRRLVPTTVGLCRSWAAQVDSRGAARTEA